ncbi:MAG: hypothetical protein R3A10_18840 [Caldilineaceae bacterium]
MQPAELITYTLSYTNTINGAWPSVVLTETVPVNTRFVISGSSGGRSCADGDPAGTTCTLTVGARRRLRVGPRRSWSKYLTP